MAIAGTSSLSNGSVMDWTEVQTNLDLWRTWLQGGIVAGDLSAAAMLRDHVVKPTLVEFPVHGMIGELVDIYGFADNLGGSPVPGKDGAAGVHVPVAIRRERDTIHPYLVAPDDMWWTRFGTSFYVPQNESKIRVGVQCMVHANGDIGATYPDGAGGGYMGGRLVLALVDRDARGYTLLNESAAQIYPPDETDRCHLSSAGSIGEGAYDIVLCYKRLEGATPNSALLQFDISRVHFTVNIAK